MKPPCYQCTERTVTCHGKCDRYAAFVAKREELREKHRQAQETTTIQIDGILRNKKRMNLKG